LSLSEEKIEKVQKFSNFFLYGLFFAFKTLTIDLVYIYDITTAENVGTGIPLNHVILPHGRLQEM
jgi:hypothetical protein